MNCRDGDSTFSVECGRIYVGSLCGGCGNLDSFIPLWTLPTVFGLVRWQYVFCWPYFFPWGCHIFWDDLWRLGKPDLPGTHATLTSTPPPTHTHLSLFHSSNPHLTTINSCFTPPFLCPTPPMPSLTSPTPCNTPPSPSLNSSLSVSHSLHTLLLLGSYQSKFFSYSASFLPIPSSLCHTSAIFVSLPSSPPLSE